MFETMREEARNDIVGRLEEGYEGYLCELHNEVFNTGCKYSLNDKAIEALEEDDIFKAIDTIVEYEKDNFGQVYTDFSKPYKVANMLYYIIGEEELYSMFDGCKEWDEWWSEEIGETECKMLLVWLKDHNRI